jgi:Protein prenyltransferase alpha subunit repeat
MGSVVGEGLLEAIADELCCPSGIAISELGIFFSPCPQSQDQNVSSAIYRTPDTLGIASWALSLLYREAKARLASSRSDYRAATAMLVVCPDYATAWHVRKRQMTDISKDVSAEYIAELVDDELRLNAVILTRNPKSVEAWSHRSWILRVFGLSCQRIEVELALGWKTASAARSNYYAGANRMRALDQGNSHTVAAQIALSREWLQKNVSDSSGWWFHLRSVQRYLQLKGIDPEFLLLEAAFADDMFATYGNLYESVRKYHEWFGALSE